MDKSWRYKGREKLNAELFTDREEQSAAFKKMLKAVDDDPEDEGSKVITFYGEGGIGKSWLLQQKLDNVIEKEQDKLKKQYAVAYYDLNSSLDILRMLCSIRAQIAAQNPAIAFPVFDAAIKRYQEESHSVIDIPTIGKNKKYNSIEGIIEGVVETLSVISPINELYMLYKSVRTGAKLMSAQIEKLSLSDDIKMALKDVLDPEMTADDIMNNVATWFSLDINYRPRGCSVVFMIDTLEKMMNERDAVKWRDILIDRLPGGSRNVLWVFASRERVYPDEMVFEADFEIGEYSVNEFSEKDSYTYLKEKQGIEDEEIINHIYKMTGGSPVFLYICADSYRRKGRPTVEHFTVSNKTELINRYVKYLSDRERDIIHTMSSVIHWKEGDFKEIFMDVHGLKSFAAYNGAYSNLVQSTMITQSGNERFFLHRAVSSAIYDDELYHEDTKKDTADSIMRLYRKRVVDEHADPIYYKERLIELIDHRIEHGELLNGEAFEHLLFIIQELVYEVEPYGISHSRDLLDLIERITRILDDESSSYIEVLAGALYSNLGEHEKALDLFRRSINGRKVPVHFFLVTKMAEAKELIALADKDPDNKLSALIIMEGLIKTWEKVSGHDSEDAMKIKIQIADFYNSEGKCKDAIPILNDVIAECRRIRPNDIEMIILAGKTLAVSYLCAEDFPKSVTTGEWVLEVAKKFLGQDHIETLEISYNLAQAYNVNNEPEKAAALREEALKRSFETYGNESYITQLLREI